MTEFTTRCIQSSRRGLTCQAQGTQASQPQHHVQSSDGTFGAVLPLHGLQSDGNGGQMDHDDEDVIAAELDPNQFLNLPPPSQLHRVAAVHRGPGRNVVGTSSAPHPMASPLPVPLNLSVLQPTVMTTTAPI